MNKKRAYLVLKDGTVFEGYSFGFESGGSEIGATGEAVFNTSMTGYQEILTDPSYAGQLVTMTYPMIGNYGINSEDVESDAIQAAALIVKENSQRHSNFRAQQSLADYLKENEVVGIEGIETRSLVRHIRNKGAMPALIAVEKDFVLNIDELKQKASQLASMEGQDLVSKVSTQKVYSFDESLWDLEEGYQKKNSSGKRYRLAVYDYGLKKNILRHLVAEGFDPIVYPASARPEELLAQNPDAIFLSNGPGDPAAVGYAIKNVKELMGKKPMFGICLGHQIASLALGARTYKLKFGHRGGNQPVKDLQTGKIEISSQNHGFAVDSESLKDKAEITHINLNDKTVEGIELKEKQFFSIQYHPEASPGPHDSNYLFERFRMMLDS